MTTPSPTFAPVRRLDLVRNDGVTVLSFENPEPGTSLPLWPTCDGMTLTHAVAYLRDMPDVVTLQLQSPILVGLEYTHLDFGGLQVSSTT